MYVFLGLVLSLFISYISVVVLLIRSVRWQKLCFRALQSIAFEVGDIKLKLKEVSELCSELDKSE